MSRSAVLLLSCLALGALFFWGSFELGRASRESDGPTRNATDSSKAPSQGKSSDHRWNQLLAAAGESYTPPGEASLDALKKRFEASANKSLFFLDPETVALLGTLKAEDCAEAAKFAAGLPNANRMSIVNAILARWAQFEPRKAAEFSVNELSPYDTRTSLAAVFQAWGESDPQGALDFHQNLASSGRFHPGLDTVLTALFFTWGQKDTAAAAKAAESLGEGGSSFYPWVGIATLAETEVYRPQALEAALAVSDEKIRTKALGWVIGKWAGREPQAAAAWLDNNDYTDQATQWSVSQRYQRLDPRGNADWLLERSTKGNREKALSMALNSWARSDIEEASTWLEKIGPTDGSIQIIATVYTATDMPKAIEWAQRASEQGRDGVIANILAHARQFDLKMDLTPYLNAGTISAEEMEKKVEVQAHQMRGRL